MVVIVFLKGEPIMLFFYEWYLLTWSYQKVLRVVSFINFFESLILNDWIALRSLYWWFKMSKI